MVASASILCRGNQPSSSDCHHPTPAPKRVLRVPLAANRRHVGQSAHRRLALDRRVTGSPICRPPSLSYPKLLHCAEKPMLETSKRKGDEQFPPTVVDRQVTARLIGRSRVYQQAMFCRSLRRLERAATSRNTQKGLHRAASSKNLR